MASDDGTASHDELAQRYGDAYVEATRRALGGSGAAQGARSLVSLLVRQGIEEAFAGGHTCGCGRIPS